MSYFHVLMYLDESRSAQPRVISDLSEAQLRERFVEPYRRGKDIFLRPDVVRLTAIRKVHIVHTDRTSEAELAHLQEQSKRRTDELNRLGGPIILGLGRGHRLEHIVDAGADVTADYIKGPPGYEASNTAARILSNPWIRIVGGGLIVAWLAWRLGWAERPGTRVTD